MAASSSTPEQESQITAARFLEHTTSNINISSKLHFLKLQFRSGSGDSIQLREIIRWWSFDHIKDWCQTALSRLVFPKIIHKANSNSGISAIMESNEARRYAVVTGANKGIGFEVARQLASQGVVVVLTARDEKRGREAASKLHHEHNLHDNVVFHQLDVLDPVSVQSLANFIHYSFGRLDILVNNAGASGVIVDEDTLRALNIDPTAWLSGEVVNKIQGAVKHTFEKAEECLNTNYYGVKRVTEALLPLLELSPGGARIVNVSSLRSELRRIPSEEIRNELGNVEALTEEKVDAVLRRFLHDFKENRLEANGWTMMLPAYSISKATLNAYTRILAKKYPKMHVNCVHPGYVNTDINWHTGPLTVEVGAAGPLKLALLPDGGPSGCYFDQTQEASFY